MNQRRGVSRTEFVVVLVVVLVGLSLLTAVLTPSLSGRGHDGRRTVCATNLKSIGTAIAAYAAGNQDHFPVLGDAKGLQWLCDETPVFIQSLESAAAGSNAPGFSADSTRRWFYCPENRGQDPATLEKWNGISVWGYVVFNDRGSDATGMPRSLPARTPPQPAIEYRTWLTDVSDAADAELALDWIISDSANPSTARFTGITRPGSPPLAFDTSHLSGQKPHGANVLAFDNHVEWRNLDASKAVAIRQSGAGAPYFWVPIP